MTNLSQYRLGNIVNSKGSLCQIASIAKDKSIAIHIDKKDKKSHNFSPQPLSSSILLEFGFKRDDHGWGSEYYLLRNEYEVYFSVEHWKDHNQDSAWNNYWYIKQTIKPFDLKFVHQLQNIYFALTGQELELKP